jgi:hypothetical protein
MVLPRQEHPRTSRILQAQPTAVFEAIAEGKRRRASILLPLFWNRGRRFRRATTACNLAPQLRATRAKQMATSARVNATAHLKR